MQIYNTLYSNSLQLQEFLHAMAMAENDALLVQIFAGSQDISLLQGLIDTIISFNAHAVIVGASTAGEILEGSMLEATIVVSCSVFHSTSLIACSKTASDSYEVGKTLCDAIVTPKTKAVIIFADGLLCNGDALLKPFNEVQNNDFIISGGMAGDYSQFQHTFVIHNDKIFEGGAVGVSLNSDILQANKSYNLAWQAIGTPMQITKSESNRVYEIDNTPILEVYREYLGEEIVQNLPDSSIEFPLIFQQANISVARSIVSVEKDYAVFAGELPEGTQVRFGTASSVHFEDGRRELYNTNIHFPIESLFVYSCVGRKTFLDKELETELRPLTQIAPVSGFFTYGELYSGEHEFHMLNITTTLLALSESNTYNKTLQEQTKAKSRLSLSTTALIHLVEKTIQKLEKESEEKKNTIALLDQYQKAIDDSYIISKADTRGVITFANDLFCEVSGYSREELIGKPHSLVRHPNMPSSTFEEMWQTIKSKHIWRGVVQNLHKNGSSYYVDATIFPILDKDTNILGYVGIRDDITDIHIQKKRAEAILNAQESIVLLTSLQDNVMQVKQLNQKFFDIFDYKDMDDFLSKHSCICDLFIEAQGYLSRSVGEKSWLEVLLEDTNKSHLVLVNDKEKHQRVFSVKATEIHLESESFIISTFTDVTELETARIQALGAEKAKSAFLATMSHELRTPLNAVIGFSQILMSKNDMPYESIKNFIEKINISGKHLLNLVNNILDFSKIDSGSMELNKKEFILSKLIEESLLLVESQLHQKSMSVSKHNFEGKSIVADEQLIKQVVVNLLSNAIKFSPKGSKITIECKCEKDFHHIRICDEGVGLTPEQTTRIFESFSQVKEHQNEAIKGTGLGLAISKKIVELHNGEIRVESEVSKGSCFTISLPLQGRN